MTRYTDNFMGFWELQALIVLAAGMSGCAAKKPVIDQPGIHHYSHCIEVSRDVKENTVTVVCPLEQNNGKRR